MIQNIFLKRHRMGSTTVVQMSRTELQSQFNTKKQTLERGITSKRVHSSSIAYYSVVTKKVRSKGIYRHNGCTVPLKSAM